MKKRTLGRSGLRVSEIGLGCWQLGNDFGLVEENISSKILHTAASQHITFYDTADVYGSGLSEERIGKWLKKYTSNTDKPIIASKVGRNSTLFPNGYTKKNVRKSLEGSIKRLGVDVLDLAQLHCVPSNVLKNGDLLSWMDDFQNQGLIKHFGASVETIDEALFCCTHSSLCSIQIIFNIFRQDAIDQLLPIAADNNIGVIVRLPLASGLLSGKMEKNRLFSQNDHRHYNKNGEVFHVGETFNGLPFEQGVDLANITKQLIPDGMTLPQMALRWLLDQPQVSTVIVGATDPKQVISNARTSELAPLNKTLHTRLNKLYNEEVKQHIRGGV